MYIPDCFEITDREEIHSFLTANAFGELVSTVNGRLFATHLPFLVADDLATLTAHMAIQNPQWKNIADQPVLAIFNGPHGYISPGWYGSPGVPTWNYQAVHVYGECEVFDDAMRLKQLVDALTEKYEAAFEQPYQPIYNEKLLQAIIGVEIRVTDIQCTYKLSQNKSRPDRERVIENLERRGSNTLATAMKSNEL